MAGVSSSSGRARALRIATAVSAVLMCAGVFGSVASAASPTTVKISCEPQQLIVGQEGSCEALVSSPGGAPTGKARFERIGFANLGPGSCKLIPISTLASSCVLHFRVTGPGALIIGAGYEDSTHEFAKDLFFFPFVGPGGSIAVECSPEIGFPNEPSTCEAFVPDTPGVTTAPTGTLHFRAETQGSTGEKPGLQQHECALEAVPGGARCAVTYIPLENGNDAISAEYAGDDSHPAQFGSVIYIVLFRHETAISASCGPNPTTLAPTTCTATVVNLNPTGGAPKGEVNFEEIREFGDFPPFPFASCDLEEVDDPKANESSCQIQYQPTSEGPQTLRVQFATSETFEESRSSFSFEVIDPRTTATKLTCSPAHGTFAGVCTASVTDTSAKPVPVSGTIRLNVPKTVKANLPTCTLAPGASGCSFVYSMTTIGSALVTAEYSGDNKGHLPSSAQATASKVP
jgi:hypothetical protein